jgi:thiol:disulfide interchange protein DsbA
MLRDGLELATIAPKASPRPRSFPLAARKDFRLKRRHFSALAAASLGLGLVNRAGAQGALVAGQDYQKLDTPQQTSAPAGTVDVVEFFSYACPHCFEFEPALEAWLKRSPPGVHFHRYPVRFLQNAVNFQPMYFALEVMGLADTLSIKVFNAVHIEHQRLDSPEAISAFMTKNGVDAAKFMATFNSFSVRTKVQQANAAMDAFGVNSVPTIAVGGRYLTSPAQAKGEARTLTVVEGLVAQIRAGH